MKIKNPWALKQNHDSWSRCCFFSSDDSNFFCAIETINGSCFYQKRFASDAKMRERFKYYIKRMVSERVLKEKNVWAAIKVERPQRDLKAFSLYTGSIIVNISSWMAVILSSSLFSLFQAYMQSVCAKRLNRFKDEKKDMYF